MEAEILQKLRCPVSLGTLTMRDGCLRTADNRYEYRITESGIPLFAEQYISLDASRQLEHYQRVADKYVENLLYPHTQEYMAYLDRIFLAKVKPEDLAEPAEICCGHGEMLGLVGSSIGRGVGVDISPAMLEAGKRRYSDSTNFAFIQGDATRLPLASEAFSAVFMLGGIHHVLDRTQLFSEVFRILKPGGHFYFREPVSDFFLWRWIRAVIYRISPALDSVTERPLRWAETVPVLKRAGFEVTSWQTVGFLGFCLFMNSDVLIFNRLFRFMPGIRMLTRLGTRIDDLMARIPCLRHSGLQVVGVAKKPIQVAK